MLDRANHVRDLEVVIVDGARQVIEARAVGALHDVVLLVGPIERDVAADEVVKPALAVARHLEADDTLATFGFEAPRVGVRRGHPLAAIEERALVLLRGRALGLDLVGRRVVAIGIPVSEQLLDGNAVARLALRLEVRLVGAADLGPLVPIEPEPAEAVEDRLQRLGDVALLIGIVDAQQELPAALAREQPIEQRRPDTPDVQIARGARREPCPYRHSSWSLSGAQCTCFWRLIPAGAAAGRKLLLHLRHSRHPWRSRHWT